MTPHGLPTTTFSAFWHASDNSLGERVTPAIDSSALAVATSSAALDATPAPSGTSDSTYAQSVSCAFLFD